MAFDSNPAFDPMRLRQLRYEAGLSQAQLANMAGISVTTVSRLECSANTPTLATAQQLASTLGVDLDELLPTKNGR